LKIDINKQKTAIVVSGSQWTCHSRLNKTEDGGLVPQAVIILRLLRKGELIDYECVCAIGPGHAAGLEWVKSVACLAMREGWRERKSRNPAG